MFVLRTSGHLIFSATSFLNIHFIGPSSPSKSAANFNYVHVRVIKFFRFSAFIGSKMLFFVLEFIKGSQLTTKLVYSVSSIWKLRASLKDVRFLSWIICQVFHVANFSTVLSISEIFIFEMWMPEALFDSPLSMHSNGTPKSQISWKTKPLWANKGKKSEKLDQSYINLNGIGRWLWWTVET